ncbi:MAG: tetratricopeptide repeat protein [Opitutaceae bacterium]
MQPAKLQALLADAVGHHRAGRLGDAENLYRKARAAAPKDFDVLHLSGLLAYQQGHTALAVDWLGRAHRIDRKSAVCQMRFGLALLTAGRAAEAEMHLRAAVKGQPDFHEGWDNLAYCLKLQDRLSEAVTCHQQATKLKPNAAAGWYNFGLTLSLLGRPADALACHERAIAADSGYALARFGRAQALHQTHRMAEAVADYEKYLELQPNHHEARSYRLFALHSLEGVSREDLFAAHVEYGRIVGRATSGVGTALPSSNVADPRKRIRVAILSPDLRAHSCAYFLEPLLRHLDPAQIELLLYHDHFRKDAISERFEKLAVVWREFAGKSDAVVEAAIRADAPDVLIDLAGHTGMTNRLPLFARRLAPVQITYLGYPNTTGLPAMDYRFTDETADPTGVADAFATESLVRFAPTAWTYVPPGDAPEVATLPCEAQPFTFGCFNSLAKITDAMLLTWAKVIAAVPNARLLLKGPGLGEAGIRETYLKRLRDSGIPAPRVELFERTLDTASHLALYHRVDVALDTFPYHGTTTTCEALWMGVPVVTVAGDRHMSRVGASLLTAIGRREWVAESEEEYVRIAAGFFGRREELRQTRAGLRAAVLASALGQHEAQATRFSAAIRDCWVRWCQNAAVAA